MASPECVDQIREEGLDPAEIIAEAKRENVWFVNDDFLDRFIEEEEEIEAATEDLTGEEETLPPSDKPQIEKGPSPQEDAGIPVSVERGSPPAAKDIESRLTIKTESDVTGRSTSDGSIESFTDYFTDKYESLKSVLTERMNFHSPTPLESLTRQQGKTNAAIVVMVTDKRESAKGNQFLDVEDPTGTVTVMLANDEPKLRGVYESILTDEVIGIEGTMSNTLFIAREIVQPDLPFNRQPRYADEPVHAALLSDTHVGSYLFLEKEFHRFLDFVTGKSSRNDLADTLKYILIAGDLVDGIGIYPNQEKELTIPDIYDQYDHFARLLEHIPDHIEVVCCMGNHDAVRLAEPQPQLERSFAERLYELPNVHVTGNPVALGLHGVDVLMYHGTTLDTIIGNLSTASYRSPETAMVEYLKRRHLAPSYGRDNLAPEGHDYMAIADVPDILHCGHVHTNGYATYRNVKIINSGTFQGRTKYQEQLGHEPTPARVPLVNLQNHEISVLHFGGES